MTAPAPQCQPMTDEYPLPWIMGPFGDIWVAADVELHDGKWRELVPEPRIVVTLGLRGGAVAKQIIAAVNSHAILKARIEEQQKVCDSYADENQRFHDRIEELERTVDLLESNARMQAKLLADTGRRAESMEAALREVEAYVDASCDLHAARTLRMIRSALQSEKTT